MGKFLRNDWELVKKKLSPTIWIANWMKNGQNEKYEIVSESNVKGSTASYNAFSCLYNKVFQDIKLANLQTVIDTYGGAHL